MRQACKTLAIVGFISFAVASHAQSLGDVAREQRQKQAKDAHPVHKVVTNEDIPESPEATSTTSVTDEPAAPASNDTHAAEQWKAKLETQRNTIASLQSQIDKLNASIHFAGPNCVANCVQYNERQIHKQDEVERLQKQLEEQKQKLEEMQESARKAGLGSSVYEP
jgi:predicted RNase H-like nuclease (RuvC/YqgF family)